MLKLSLFIAIITALLITIIVLIPKSFDTSTKNQDNLISLHKLNNGEML